MKYLFAPLLLALHLSSFARAEISGVVVSIPPLQALVGEVMGETGKPKALLQGNESPHDFQLKPSQLSELQHADLVFYIHPEFESFLVKALGNLPENITQVPLAEAIKSELLPQRSGGVWEIHEHDLTAFNYHIWLDPIIAKALADDIAARLAARYPEFRDVFLKNAEALKTRLDALDTKIKTQLSSAAQKRFIVFHDAYPYFEKRYQLQVVGSITLEPTETPSVKRIEALRQKITDEQVDCVFTEPQFNPKILGRIIEDSPVKVREVNPLAVSGKDEFSYEDLITAVADAMQCR